MQSTIDGAFEKIVEQAVNDVTCTGWDNASQKTVTLAAIGMMYRALKRERLAFSRPIYWLAGVLGGGIVWQIIEFAISHS